MMIKAGNTGMQASQTSAQTAAVPPASWRPVFSRMMPILLLLPTLAWIFVFFLVPLGLMCWRSLEEGGFSLAPYESLLLSPLYLNVLKTSFEIALITTAGCLFLGYPVAYFLTISKARTRGIILLLIIIPYWLDYIVRSYSWMVLLGRKGLVNRTLIALGFTDEPLELLYSLFSVGVGMVQILLPLMILTLFAAMLRIDLRLMDAATIHGANRRQAFWSVFFPLSLPGVYGACLLVLVIALGFYITPELLGGPRQTMISQTIMVLASELLDWSLASAAGIVLLIITMIIVMIYNHFFSLERLWGGTDV